MKTKTTLTILSASILALGLTACVSAEESPVPEVTAPTSVSVEASEDAHSEDIQGTQDAQEPQTLVFENPGLPTVTLNPGSAPTIDVEAAGVVRDATDLTVVTLIEGDGMILEAGGTATLHYHGVLLSDGAFVDGSYDGEPAVFEIGTGHLIQGWDEGLVGQTAGSTVLLVIPSDLAYGETEIEGALPAHSDLVFVVEVLEIH